MGHPGFQRIICTRIVVLVAHCFVSQEHRACAGAILSIPVDANVVLTGALRCQLIGQRAEVLGWQLMMFKKRWQRQKGLSFFGLSLFTLTGITLWSLPALGHIAAVLLCVCAWMYFASWEGVY